MAKAHAELKKKSPAALQQQLQETQMELIKLRAQIVTGAAAKEVGKLHKLKKTVARINTLLHAAARRTSPK